MEGLLNLPIAYLIIAPAMASFDAALEESSRVCGAGNGRTLRRITLPVTALFYISLVPYSIVPSARAFAAMSLKHWVTVAKDSLSLLSLKNSLFLGVFGATVGIVLSIFVAYVIVKVKTKSAGILESLSFLSFSFPRSSSGWASANRLFLKRWPHFLQKPPRAPSWCPAGGGSFPAYPHRSP